MPQDLETKRGFPPELTPKAADAGRKTRADGDAEKPRPREVGGRKGPDPTRYGDWEKNGRCIDF